MLAWYDEMRRDLPWRRTRDPYAILVSEIMLQQTRVEAVLGRYESFMSRFPTVAELAAAPLDEVLAEWSGLGYYRRPRALHALARTVVKEHGGEIPRKLEDLLAQRVGTYRNPLIEREDRLTDPAEDPEVVDLARRLKRLSQGSGRLWITAANGLQFALRRLAAGAGLQCPIRYLTPETEPGDDAAWGKLAWAYLAKRDPGRAAVCARAALRIRPYHARHRPYIV